MQGMVVKPFEGDKKIAIVEKEFEPMGFSGFSGISGFSGTAGTTGISGYFGTYKGPVYVSPYYGTTTTATSVTLTNGTNTGSVLTSINTYLDRSSYQNTLGDISSQEYAKGPEEDTKKSTSIGDTISNTVNKIFNAKIKF